MAKLYYHNFKVIGAGHFPMDMLRYYHCWPRSSDDCSMLPYNEYTSFQPVRTITLQSFGPRDWQPTFARWKSFGWSADYIDKGAEV